MDNNQFSNNNRIHRLDAVSTLVFDLIIIGGGITGAGIVFDATQRGLKTLLLEKGDFASGTSSKSTKLIHGGLRYLKQLEFGLVRETGLERAIAHRNICHLVHPEQMLLPIVKQGSFNALTASLAIGVYDALANVPKEQRKKRLTKSHTLNYVPTINQSILKSSIVYSEYRTDDARLTIELIKSARIQNGEAFNYMKVDSFTYDNGVINGVKCSDKVNGNSYTFKGSKVVSATGPWVDELRQKDDKGSTKNLHLSKGVHIVFSKERFPLSVATYFDVFDSRMIFAIPRGNAVYVGTTDNSFDGDSDHLKCNADDAKYLIDATNTMFPNANLTIEDVESTWVGLRPLIQQEGKSAKELSRKDEIFRSKSGLLSIAGGKLTGFRKMAERIVDLVCKDHPAFKNKRCETKHAYIHSKPFLNYKEYKQFLNKLINMYPQFEEQDVWHLVTTYGREASIIIGYALSNSKEVTLKEKLILSQLQFSIEQEAVYHPLDFFDRRTGWMFFDIDKVRTYADLVCNEMADLLNIPQQQMMLYTQELAQSISLHSLEQFKK